MLKKSFSLLLLPIILTSLVGCGNSPGKSSSTPDFIQAGKKYEILFVPLQPQECSVIEVNQGGWIKVKSVKFEDPIWINVNSVNAIRELNQ